MNVLLLFQIRDGKAQLAPVSAQLGARRETARPAGIGAGTRAPLWEGGLPQRVGELAERTQAPPQEREPAQRPGEPGAAARSAREREASLHVPGAAAAAE